MKALITGITGQDGAYLSRLLIEKEYEVHGVQRRASSDNTGRLREVLSDLGSIDDLNLTLHYGDLTDTANISDLVSSIQPTEIYNLAAQSHVQVSFDTPEYTTNTDAVGTLRLLEAVRHAKSQQIRFYQASTSEMFGKVHESPQRETTPFYPRSPYGVAKLYAHWITVNYREAYDLHASSGILFNHESPFRGEEFVTRKITRAAAARHAGHPNVLALGNLDAQRDWGHARDYVDGMWRMLQQETPDDYVLATGETRTVRDFVEIAFGHIGRGINWSGSGTEETGRDAETGDVLVAVDPRFFRPVEVDLLLGDPAKAKRTLGWSPQTSFEDLVSEMMQYDISRASGSH